MASKKSTITYLVGWEEKKDITERVHLSISVDNRPVSKFSNCQHQMINVSAFARVYLDHLCEKMDEKTNVVHINTRTKQEFLQELWRNTLVERSMELVKKAADNLKRNNLLIKLGRGIYAVNPRYFYKSSEVSRKEIIKEYIEWVFSQSLENESNYREAFGIKESVIQLAKKLKRFP